MSKVAGTLGEQDGRLREGGRKFEDVCHVVVVSDLVTHEGEVGKKGNVCWRLIKP